MENSKAVSRGAALLNRIPGGSSLTAAEGIKAEPTKVVGGVTVPAQAVIVKPFEPPAAVSNEPEYSFDETPTEKEKVEVLKEAVSVPAEPKPEDFIPEDPTDEIEAAVDPKEDPRVGMKKLREKYKTVNKKNKEYYAELEALKPKLKGYEDGTAVPEVVTALQKRIEELEPYEKAQNFKASTVYREKFAKPIREAQEKLKELAVNAEVDVDILNKAFAAENEIESNKILANAFADPLSAIEAKGLIKSIKNVQDQAAEAEKDAVSSLARLQEENDRIENEQKEKVRGEFLYNSKEAWSESLQHLRGEDRFPELKFVEGDTEHNEKIVRPILTKASQEFGRIVNACMQQGMKSMPKELGVAMARMTQLAHQSAVATHQRNVLQARVDELEAKLYNTHRVNRPGVNRSSAVPANMGGSRAAGVGAERAGANVLARVTGKVQ